jgi:hypothetical protein
VDLTQSDVSGRICLTSAEAVRLPREVVKYVAAVDAIWAEPE